MILTILSLSINLYSQRHYIRFSHLSIEHGLSQGSILCMIQDSKGFIWFGTEAGLNKYDGYNITVYKPEKGNFNSLSNNYIYSIYEDHLEILWIGTDNGLNKFNREKNNFIQYKSDLSNPNSLSSNRVFSIFEDRSGTLWIGTDSGLNKFNRQKEQFTRYRSSINDPHSLSHNDIRSICEDRSGSLWIGTYGGGLNKFDWRKEKFIQYKNYSNDPNSLSDNYVLSVFEDHLGILWVGTKDGGLNRFDRTKNQFTCYKNDPRDTQSLSDNWVNCIYEDQSGVLWIGTNDGGLNRFNRERETFTRYLNDPNDSNSLSGNRILSIYEDNSGILWIGTYGAGLNKFSKEANNFLHFQSNPRDSSSLSHNHARSFYEEQSGVLWVGTDGGGITKFDRQNRKTIYYQNNPNNPNSLSNNRIFSIVEDQSGLFWIGTYGSGLNKFDPQKERFTHHRHNSRNPLSLSDDRIRTIYESRSGILWIGTDGGGFNRFDREKESFTQYKNDPDNPNSLSNNRVFSIVEDQSGTLWIGTFGGGVDKFNPENEEFIHYRANRDNSHSLSNDYILSIHIYKKQPGILWIGSNGGGLTKFDPRKEIFINYTESDGLPNNVIYGILEDDGGNLWLSTNKGISKFAPQTEIFKNYDVSDGLQSNEFYGGSYHKSQDGWMYFGGINGFNAFYPKNVRENPHIPSVVITDFQIFNKSVPIGEMADGRTILKKSITETNEIELSYKDNVFSFEFAALHYVFPEKNEYAHMMEGFDKNWIHTNAKKRFTSYTNLAPREYVFRVKASNNDSVWNEEGTSVRIIITPPFWQTWWFKCFGIIFVLLLFVTVYQVRTHGIRERAAQLEKRVEERTLELKTANMELQQEITERNQAEQEVKRRAAQAALIYEAGQRVSSELKLETLLLEIVNAVRDAFNYDGVMMLLFDEEAECLTLQSKAGSYVDPFPRNLRIAPGEGIIGYAVTSGKTQVSGDVSKDPHFIRYAGEKTKSELAIPIKGKEKKIVGVLDIQSGEFDAFNETDMTAMETLSTQIATAIENASLYEESQREIRERKRAERKVQESEKHLRSLFDRVPVALYRTTREGKIIDANPAMVEMFHYQDLESLQKINAADLYLNPQARKQWQVMIGREGIIRNLEKQMRCQDGEIIWVCENVRTVKGIKGRILNYEGSLEDITERKRAEEALRKSEEKYRTLNENINVGIYRNSTGPKGKFLEVNPAAVKIFGYESKEKFLTVDIVDQYQNPEDRKKFYKKMSRYGFLKDEELKLKKKNGTPFIASVSEVAIKNNKGEVMYYDGIIEDITERKKAEEKLKKIMEELRHSNTELKDFGHIVSHDLKAPLRAISQLAKWISEDYADAFDEEGKKQMNILLGRVVRMDNIINGILQYSRAGRLRGKMEEIDLNSILREVLESIAPPDNIKVTIEDKLPVIFTDRVRIEQVFQNLISNAIKYMDKPEGEVRIGCVDENSHWRFSVSDNGPGIDEKYHNKIFQIFQTLESRDKQESTGVGLSVVKKIIELYDGKIWVESKVGEGSTFFFTLKKGR